MTDRKKPSVAFWATVVRAEVVVEYPLIVGPWYWTSARGSLPVWIAPFDHFYDPLRWVVARSPERFQYAITRSFALAAGSRDGKSRTIGTFPSAPSHAFHRIQQPPTARNPAWRSGRPW